MNKPSELYVKKSNNFSSFEDLKVTVGFLAKDIAVFLNEEIEELNVSSHIFRAGLERSLLRMLNALIKQDKQVVIFPDSIPGFTLMTFRKVEIVQTEGVLVERNANQEMAEFSVLNSVMNRQFSKNKQKILLIENDDLLFALFPVADTRKNLKELDLYITY